MKKNLAQGCTVVAEILKTIGSLKPSSSKLSTMSTISIAKPQTSLTTQAITEPSSSSSFLETDKEMLELKEKLL